MPRVPSKGADDRQARRHDPLAEQYELTGPSKQKASKKRKASQQEDDEGNVIGTKASRRILKIGQDLVDEDKEERKLSEPNPAFDFSSRFDVDDQDDDPNAFDDDEAWGDEDEEVIEEVEIDPNDRDIFDRFLPSIRNPTLDPNNLSFDSPNDTPNAEQTTNLADLILEKIAAHEAATAAGGSIAELDSAEPDYDEPPLPPKVIEVYTQIGQLLSRHRSGPLPKPFKILTTLPPYQIVPLLDLTRPDNWTAHVHLLSVRLFISARPDIATPYLHTILLPRVRSDIHETRKLHVHLYAALKKALYKPACFFKGILFPLLEESNSCTLREAQIISSVISRVSVPVLHSAAALLRLCDIAAAQFSARSEDGGGAGGATSIFIRCLLDKRYALPYKVVDALVFHFLRFRSWDPASARPLGAEINMFDGEAEQEEGKGLPVLWHQSFLAFAQRYRNDITEDQREALLDLVVIRGHRQMGPEVRRELLEGRGRGVAPEPSTRGPADGGDDTMALG